MEKKKVILLVDYENRPRFISEMTSEQMAFVSDIYIFVYKNHPLLDKPLPAEKTTIILTDSSHPNGSDCCIQMYVGLFLLQNEYDDYVIVTEDKFANPLVDHVESKNQKWQAAKAHIILTPQQLSSIYL